MLKKKLINLSNILDIENYTNSLDRWLNISNHIRSEQERAKLFEKYLKIVKPKIHKYHQITSTLNHLQYGFYSKQLSINHKKILTNCYQNLKKFQIISKEQIQSSKEDGHYEYLSQQNFNQLITKPSEETYLIDLETIPKNKELSSWGTYLDVESVSFNSLVIHGKGIAKKSLGFPTANLLVTELIEQRLNSYPNGIYLVKFSFSEEQIYFGICSIGTNPHYQNSLNRRFVEVYVYKNFGESEFYGAQVLLELLVLLRFEGKFQTFDCFLNAMHNDIITGNIISKKFKPHL